MVWKCQQALRLLRLVWVFGYLSYLSVFFTKRSSFKRFNAVNLYEVKWIDSLLFTIWLDCFSKKVCLKSNLIRYYSNSLRFSVVNREFVLVSISYEFWFESIIRFSTKNKRVWFCLFFIFCKPNRPITAGDFLYCKSAA